MIGYIFALLPIYVFLYLPIQHMLSGSRDDIANFRGTAYNASLIASDEPLDCPAHSYDTFIVSRQPLIIYIENFLSPEESKHLLDISEGKFEASTVTSGNPDDVSIRENIRVSESALLERDDTVRCIEHRARDFQGWNPYLHIERLRTQRYTTGGYYKHHYDWNEGPQRSENRITTFNVYVQGDCEGGGTEFPRIRMPDTAKGRWCEFLECGEKPGDDEEQNEKMGVTFKAISGNAIFWENLSPDGNGYDETWHSGMPVKSGTKVGLNIWSWGVARRY